MNATVTTLIAELQAILAKYGDLPVCAEDGMSPSDMDFNAHAEVTDKAIYRDGDWSLKVFIKPKRFTV